MHDALCPALGARLASPCLSVLAPITTLLLYCTCTAAAVLYEVELDRGLPWLDALKLLEQHREAAAAGPAAAPGGGDQLPPVVLAASTPVDADGEAEQQDVKIEQKQEQEPELEQQQQQQPEQLKQEQQQPGSSDSVQPGKGDVAGRKTGKRPQAGAASDVGSTADAGAEAGTEADAKRRRIAKGKQPAQREKEESAAVDLTGSTDSDDETAAPAAAKGPHAATAAGAAAGGAKPVAGKQLSGGGFFRARQEGINRQVRCCSEGCLGRAGGCLIREHILCLLWGQGPWCCPVRSAR